MFIDNLVEWFGVARLKMSLMNYLGAVASAAIEAAGSGQTTAQASASGVPSNVATGSRENVPVTVTVSTAPTNFGGSGDASTGARVTVAPGLSGFPSLVPLTLHHSPGQGQFYAISSSGPMRLAHPPGEFYAKLKVF